MFAARARFERVHGYECAGECVLLRRPAYLMAAGDWLPPAVAGDHIEKRARIHWAARRRVNVHLDRCVWCPCLLTAQNDGGRTLAVAFHPHVDLIMAAGCTFIFYDQIFAQRRNVHSRSWIPLASLRTCDHCYRERILVGSSSACLVVKRPVIPGTRVGNRSAARRIVVGSSVERHLQLHINPFLSPCTSSRFSITNDSSTVIIIIVTHRAGVLDRERYGAVHDLPPHLDVALSGWSEPAECFLAQVDVMLV